MDLQYDFSGPGHGPLTTASAGGRREGSSYGNHHRPGVRQHLGRGQRTPQHSDHPASAVVQPATDLTGTAAPGEDANHAAISRHSGRGLRRGLLAGAASLAVGVAGLGMASTAAATVNPYGPHNVWSWGDCTLNLGNVKTSTGAAEGGLDVSCGHQRGHISAVVNLWRYNGSQWVEMTSSGWNTRYGVYGMSEWTAHAICGGGTASWDDTATVNVDGSQVNLDLGPALGYYPRYTPTRLLRLSGAVHPGWDTPGAGRGTVVVWWRPP